MMRRVWLAALIVASLLPSWLNADSFWGQSRVSLAVGEQNYSRVRMEQFRRLVEEATTRKPCLVMVDESGSDPQLSYIVNPPDFKSDVLVCRKPAEQSAINELHSTFPERTLYEFDPATFAMSEVEVPQRK